MKKYSDVLLSNYGKKLTSAEILASALSYLHCRIVQEEEKLSAMNRLLAQSENQADYETEMGVSYQFKTKFYQGDVRDLPDAINSTLTDINSLKRELCIAQSEMKKASLVQVGGCL